MRLRWAACAATICFLCAPLIAQEQRTLTLDEAFARLIARHPDLARFRYLRERALAELDETSQRPPLTAGLEIENAPGTNDASSFDEAETTLSLASVLERGGKRDARRAVAEAQLQGLTLQEDARRLDLLAEVARRYLDLLATQALAQIAETDLGQREKTVEASIQRVRAGAAPDSVRLTAEAALARARLHRERFQAESRSAAHRLAALWNDRTPDFEGATGDLLALPAVPSLETLRVRLERNPDLRAFADEARLREARVQLARSARVTDIQWQAGVRRLETSNAWTAVAGVSVPLGTAQRAQPGIRAAEADLAALSLERESEEISLYATLAEAQARLSAASVEVSLSRTDLMPRLRQAEQAAERAYRAGSLSYVEWSQLQAEAISARRDEVQAAVEARRALIEIQRLTGEDFL